MPRITSVKHSENLVKTEYTNYREDLYRQAALDLQARDSGFSRYVIGFFGADLIGSLALAIDPNKQFHNSPSTVSLLTDGDKVVRTRRKITQQRADRVEYVTKRQVSYGYAQDPQGPLFTYIYTGPIHSVVNSKTVRAQQPPLYGTSRDTTRRTRPKDKQHGEFEIFSPKFISVPRQHGHLNSHNYIYNSIGTGQKTETFSRWYSRCTGPEFVCSDADVQLLLPIIRSRALSHMAKNVYAMLDQVQPRHKTHDLSYMIAELRELPLTLKNTLQTWMSFERLVGTDSFRTLLRTAGSWRDPALMRSYARQLGHSTGFRFDELLTLDQNAAAAFLSFKFGWESMTRDVLQILPSPKRIATDINRLIDSIGQDRSFRTKKNWIERETSFPNFSTQLLAGETYDGANTFKVEGLRKIEMRLMANFNIRFPPLEIPRLRQQLVNRRFGAYPSPSTIYNLIPWTWLIDWFTGAGDYVQLMDSISGDRSIINYGFITYREESIATASVRGFFTSSVSRTVNGVNQNGSFRTYLTHEGKFKTVYQLRRSIPSLTNVREYWGTGLNPNQTAILGALASSKRGSRGRRDAS